jgi:hypothetical protein
MRRHIPVVCWIRNIQKFLSDTELEVLDTEHGFSWTKIIQNISNVLILRSGTKWKLQKDLFYSAVLKHKLKLFNIIDMENELIFMVKSGTGTFWKLTYPKSNPNP